MNDFNEIFQLVSKNKNGRLGIPAGVPKDYQKIALKRGERRWDIISKGVRVIVVGGTRAAGNIVWWEVTQEDYVQVLCFMPKGMKIPYMTAEPFLLGTHPVKYGGIKPLSWSECIKLSQAIRLVWNSQASYEISHSMAL